MFHTIDQSISGVNRFASRLPGAALAIMILLCLDGVWCVLGFVHWQQWVLFAGFAALLWGMVNTQGYYFLAWSLLVVLGFACALYRPEGFGYPM